MGHCESKFRGEAFRDELLSLTLQDQGGVLYAETEKRYAMTGASIIFVERDAFLSQSLMELIHPEALPETKRKQVINDLCHPNEQIRDEAIRKYSRWKDVLVLSTNWLSRCVERGLFLVRVI